MCQGCVDAVKKWFPKVRKKDYGDLLFGATAFPMGSVETVERQLRSMAKRGIKTVREAKIDACRRLDREMRKMQPMLRGEMDDVPQDEEITA